MSTTSLRSDGPEVLRFWQMKFFNVTAGLKDLKFYVVCSTQYTVAQWLRCCATNRKVAGSIRDGIIGIFHSHNPSDRTMALRSNQPLT